VTGLFCISGIVIGAPLDSVLSYQVYANETQLAHVISGPKFALSVRIKTTKAVVIYADTQTGGLVERGKRAGYGRSQSSPESFAERMRGM